MRKTKQRMDIKNNRKVNTGKNERTKRKIRHEKKERRQGVEYRQTQQIAEKKKQ